MVYIYDLIIFISEKTSSQREVDPKMLSNEELLIVVRQQINVYIDQTTGRDGLLAHLCIGILTYLLTYSMEQSPS
jgi:hypothetical protein